MISLYAMRYEVTLTLKPRPWYSYSAKDQFRLTSPDLLDLSKHYTVSFTAELTSSNNIHYHGIIELQDFKHRDSFINWLRKRDKVFGRYTCTQLVNEPIWIDYLFKSRELTRSIIEENPWAIDMFQLQRSRFKCSATGNIIVETGLAIDDKWHGQVPFE